MNLPSRLKHLLTRFLRRWSDSTGAYGASIAFIAHSLGAGLSLLVHVFLARWIGPGGYGTYSLAIAWASVLSIGVGLGFPEAVLRFIPSYEVDRDWNHLRGIVQLGTRTVLGLSLALSIGATLVLWFWHGTLNEGKIQALLLGSWILPLVACIRLYSEICRAIDQIAAAYLAPRLTRPIFIIGGLALLTYTSRTAPSGIWAIIFFGASCLPILWIQRNALRGYLAKREDVVSETRADHETRRWLTVGLPLLLVTGFVTVIQQTDILLIGWMLNVESAGLYKAAMTIAAPVGFVLTAINAIAAPRFSRFYTEEDHSRMRQFVRTLSHWLFWPTLVIGGIIAASAEFFLRLFGAEFTGVDLPLRILILSHIINAGTGSVGYLLNMTGHQLVSARVYGLTALLNVGTNVVGIHYFGLVGASVATTLSMLIWNAWLHILVVRRLNLAPSVVSSLFTRD